MLEDVGSKMECFWLCWAMLWHLGAKVGEQERKMRQMSEKVGFLVAWRGEGVTQVAGGHLGYPPLRNILEMGLELPPPAGDSNLEPRRTQAAAEAIYRPGHATSAYGTVADNIRSDFISCFLSFLSSSYLIIS